MSKAKPLRNKCERCGEELHPDRETMLELDQRTNTFTNSEDVPEDVSQGWFPFGATCAKVELKRHKALKK